MDKSFRVGENFEDLLGRTQPRLLNTRFEQVLCLDVSSELGTRDLHLQPLV